MVTTFKNFLSVFLLACCLILVVFSCKKDEPAPIDNPTESITIEEIKAIYGDVHSSGSSQSRSGARIPLDVIPDWNAAYAYPNASVPAILTPIDATSFHLDNRQGGNLVFFKDQQGLIQCYLIAWRSNAPNTYTSVRAPLDLNSQFSGMMMLIDDQDNIRRIMKIESGIVKKAKEGSKSILEIGGENTSGGVEDRCGDPRCPTWGPSWWERVWNWIGNAFQSILDFFGNIWDDASGGNESLPAGTFIFGGGGGINIVGYNETGGSGVIQQQFSAQMSTCEAIRQYVESIGEIPPGYSDTDLKFCTLVNELGLNGTQNQCLFTQYGSTYINDLYAYWQASDKSLATIDKIKNYINLRCSSSFSALLTDMVKEQFCLRQHPIDLIEKIKNQCGYATYESSEWYNDLNNGMSPCVQEVIVEDRKGYVMSKYGDAISTADLMAITNNNPYSCEALGAIVFAYSTVLDGSGAAVDLATRLSCFTVSGNENYTNRVILYADQPVPGDETAYTIKNGSPDVGHTFIALEQISPNGTVTRFTFGFYPSSSVNPFRNPSALGEFNHDANHNFDVSITWNLTASTFNTLVSNAISFASTPQTYHLSTFNCTTFAINLLNQVGLNVPQNSGSWPGGGGLNPGRLGEDMRTMPLQTWMTRNTTSGKAPLSSGCP